MGMRIFTYDFSSLQHEPDEVDPVELSDQSSVASEEMLERTAQIIRSELRQSEMLELAAEVERAASGARHVDQAGRAGDRGRGDSARRSERDVLPSGQHTSVDCRTAGGDRPGCAQFRMGGQGRSRTAAEPDL